jgi:phosphoglycolate phosphatase
MPASASKLTVVFDLDGTLIDTAPDLIDTMNRLFVRKGLKPVGFAEARNMIGGGVKPLLKRGLALEPPEAHGLDLEVLYAEYLKDYGVHLADRSRPFPGLDGALDALETAGARFAVCTNKLEWLSVRLLDALKLSPRFAAICGQDTFGVAKPDPEMLRRTIGAAGGDLRRAVMVGDSATDIATAKAAGIPVIAVDFGYTETPVAELGPDHVISHFDALPAAIRAVDGG